MASRRAAGDRRDRGAVCAMVAMGASSRVKCHQAASGSPAREDLLVELEPDARARRHLEIAVARLNRPGQELTIPGQVAKDHLLDQEVRRADVDLDGSRR